MAVYYPICSAVNEVQLTQVGADTINVKWKGDATTYKIASKRQEDDEYVTQDQTGPGSSGGSGINTDDTGGILGAPGAVNSTAEFNVTGTLPGIYDLRLFNICLDGSRHEKLVKFLVSIDVGTIPAIELLYKSQSQIKIKWGTPTIDSGQPFYVSWCELDQFDNSVVCDSQIVANDVREFTIPFPKSERYRVWVSQFHNEWQAASSDVISFYLCECGASTGGGSSEVTVNLAGPHFTHDQAVAAAVWTVNHNLGFKPIITVTNRANRQIDAVIVYVDDDTFEVRASEAVAGYAYYV